MSDDILRLWTSRFIKESSLVGDHKKVLNFKNVPAARCVCARLRFEGKLETRLKVIRWNVSIEIFSLLNSNKQLELYC